MTYKDLETLLYNYHVHHADLDIYYSELNRLKKEFIASGGTEVAFKKIYNTLSKQKFIEGGFEFEVLPYKRRPPMKGPVAKFYIEALIETGQIERPDTKAEWLRLGPKVGMKDNDTLYKAFLRTKPTAQHLRKARAFHESEGNTKAVAYLNKLIESTLYKK